jgi:magnesium chelatase accessory protein
MDWTVLAGQWPNAGASRFVAARPHRWHVQVMGPEDAAVLLLLHGAGGATHSWRDLMPLLARRWRVVAPDLPGHGFTKLGALQRSGLDLMAEDVAALTDRLGLTPAAIVGHSAGGALALRMAERRPVPVVGLNPALDNFKGMAGWLFPVMARALALNPLVAPTVARMTTPGSVQRLIAGTGSRIDPVGLSCYRACVADSAHVDGALTMMAQWRLDGLRARLPRIGVPVLFLTGAEDRAVPPETAARAAAQMPNARCERLDGFGHLLHEEAPETVAGRIEAFLAEVGVTPRGTLPPPDSGPGQEKGPPDCSDGPDAA